MIETASTSRLRLSSAQWTELEAAYATPVRAYHNIGHVHAMLAHYDEVAAGPGWHQPREVFAAVLFHDAIYQPGRKDNEARSAELASATLPRWFANEPIELDLDTVDRLIRLTARHGALTATDVDRQEALFLDCDMAILAAPAEAFDAYDRGIVEEYRGVVPEFLFRLNRRRFLKSLLASERIFLSDFFHQRHDAAARANLRRVTGRRG